MPSVIAWLDTSSDEQRRVREIIQLFAQSESRDELGIGQIRDAFSDSLFPGTSVIQTRARYYLFVPWTYQQGADKRKRGAALTAWTNDQERRLILTLRDKQHLGVGQGLIGRVAGAGLKILPSSIYWSGLTRYGILLADVAPDQLGILAASHSEDELVERAPRAWSPTLPPPPAGFPDEVENGLDLLPDEADWLRERILSATAGTLLAHLLTQTESPDPTSDLPWLDPTCASAQGEPAVILRHASLFSTAIHGAALVYNLLIAERYEDAGLTSISDPVQAYETRLAEWAEDCREMRVLFTTWDRADLWSRVLGVNPRVSSSTRLFVDRWLDGVVSGTALDDPSSLALRSLVSARERQLKGPQSRLVNDRLLRTWSGGSGSARLNFRWNNVRRIVTDIQEGVSARA